MSSNLESIGESTTRKTEGMHAGKLKNDNEVEEKGAESKHSHLNNKTNINEMEGNESSGYFSETTEVSSHNEKVKTSERTTSEEAVANSESTSSAESESGETSSTILKEEGSTTSASSAEIVTTSESTSLERSQGTSSESGESLATTLKEEGSTTVSTLQTSSVSAGLSTENNGQSVETVCELCSGEGSLPEGLQFSLPMSSKSSLENAQANSSPLKEQGSALTSSSLPSLESSSSVSSIRVNNSRDYQCSFVSQHNIFY